MIDDDCCELEARNLIREDDDLCVNGNSSDSLDASRRLSRCKELCDIMELKIDKFVITYPNVVRGQRATFNSKSKRRGRDLLSDGRMLLYVITQI